MLPEKESLVVEFKSDNPPLSDHVLIDEVVAMANAEGGTIYIGVENDARPTGVSLKHQDALGLSSLVANSTIPSVYVEARLFEEQGRGILEVKVPKYTHIVASKSGKIVRRALKSDGEPEMKPFYPWEFSSRLSDVGLVDMTSDYACPFEESLFDMDEARALHESVSSHPSSDSSVFGLSFEEFLFAIHALSNKGGVKMATLVGILLFGTEEALKKHCPSASFKFQWLQNGEVRSNQEDRLNICKAFLRFATFLSSHNPSSEIYDGLRRIDVPYYDVPASREAFANAIAHRDYAILGPVRVGIDETGLTISNPGTLIRGLKEKDLLSAEPRGRNPALSYALKAIGFCESSGRGVDRIYASAARFGKTIPEYRCVGEDVTCFFPKSEIDRPFASRLFGKKMPLILEIALATIRGYGPLSSESLADRLGIGLSKSKTTLDAGVEEKLLEKEPSGKYRLVGIEDAVVQVDRNTLKESVLEFAASRGGSLTREDIEQRFSLSQSRAYRLIVSLVHEGKLELAVSGKRSYYRLKRTD